jgi:hypothetical protein
MGKSCDTHELEDKCIQGFDGKVRRKDTTEKI